MQAELEALQREAMVRHALQSTCSHGCELMSSLLYRSIPRQTEWTFQTFRSKSPRHPSDCRRIGHKSRKRVSHDASPSAAAKAHTVAPRERVAMPA